MGINEAMLKTPYQYGPSKFLSAHPGISVQQNRRPMPNRHQSRASSPYGPQGVFSLTCSRPARELRESALMYGSRCNLSCMCLTKALCWPGGNRQECPHPPRERERELASIHLVEPRWAWPTPSPSHASLTSLWRRRIYCRCVRLAPEEQRLSAAVSRAFRFVEIC